MHVCMYGHVRWAAPQDRAWNANTRTWTHLKVRRSHCTSAGPCSTATLFGSCGSHAHACAASPPLPADDDGGSPSASRPLPTSCAWVINHKRTMLHGAPKESAPSILPSPPLLQPLTLTARPSPPSAHSASRSSSTVTTRSSAPPASSGLHTTLRNANG